jgi:hypothetical protein
MHHPSSNGLLLLLTWVVVAPQRRFFHEGMIAARGGIPKPPPVAKSGFKTPDRVFWSAAAPDARRAGAGIAGLSKNSATLSSETYNAERTFVRVAVRFRRQYAGPAGPEYTQQMGLPRPKDDGRGFETASSAVTGKF